MLKEFYTQVVKIQQKILPSNTRNAKRLIFSTEKKRESARVKAHPYMCAREGRKTVFPWKFRLFHVIIHSMSTA